jgi:hypothetical protein
MIPARRVTESPIMRASRSRRSVSRPASGRKRPAPARSPAAALKAAVKVPVAPPQAVLYRFCKAGWAVLVEHQPNMQGTRFVCPFCPQSHRVPGPVRGFRKVRRAQWIKMRRVEE